MTRALTTEVLRIAPTHYLSGHGVLSSLGEVAQRYGTRVLILHGTTGYPQVSAQVLSSLNEAHLSISTIRHDGYCTRDSIDSHVATARKASAELIIGIGGGRVLDMAKGVADATGIPCITIPTSPATCSATTPLVVYYDADGVYLESRLTRESPVATLVDTDTITQAPDRLLVAGLVDALAKVYEVQFATRHTSDRATTSAALSLCASLNTLIDIHATEVLGTRKPPLQTQIRALLAEAAILWPGLIGNLAGENSKLAAAHAIHNALTLLPGSQKSLHGEIIAYGILVQQYLAGADNHTITTSARFFVSLGCPCSLSSLGCSAFFNNKHAVANRALTFTSMQRCFPDLESDTLANVMTKVDTLAVTVEEAAL